MCCKGLILFIALFLGFAAAIFLIYQFYSFIRCGCGKYGPFVSSYGKLKQDVLNEARSVLKKSKKTLKVTDLGCGSGALLLPLAKEFPQHEFIGLEWDIIPLIMGKIKARLAKLNNVKFVKDNYMTASHADMDVIMCYVLKVTGEPLGKKLAAEIKENSVVISEMFPLGYLQEVKQIQSSLAGIPEKVYVYQKPRIKSAATSISKNKPTAKKKTSKQSVNKVSKAPKGLKNKS